MPVQGHKASYVGHLLTDQGVKPDSAKTASVRLIGPQRTNMA